MTAGMDAISARDELDRLASDSSWEAAVALIEQHWTALLNTHPDDLVRVVRLIPDRELVQFPRIPFAKSYLDRIVPGDHERTSRFRGARVSTRPRDLFDALLQLTFRVVREQSQGRMTAAASLSTQARELLDRATAEEFEVLRPAIPEMAFAWGYAHELAGDLDGARRELLESYDTSLIIGDEMGRARAASALAWVDALHGRNGQARDWLSRLDGTAGHWWSPRSVVPAQLAEALLLIDECRFAEARHVLQETDLSWARMRWPAHRFLSASVGVSRADAIWSLSQVDADAASMPGDVDEGEGAAFLALTRNILLRRLGSLSAARETVQRPEARSDSFAGRLLEVWQLAAEAHAGRYSQVMHVAGELLLRSSGSPRIVVTALGLKAAAEQHSGMHHAQASWDLATGLANRERIYSSLSVARQQEVHELLRASPDALPPTVTAFMLGETTSGHLDPFDVLTPRERTMLGARLSGLTIEETAAGQFISVNTVKTHFRRIYRKMGVRSFAELERLANRNGVTSLSRTSRHE